MLASSVLFAHGVQLGLNVVGNLSLESGPEDVVDPKDRGGGLRRSTHGRYDDVERFEDTCLAKIGRFAQVKVQTNACSILAGFGLSRGHVEQSVDWIESGVFRQGPRNDFERVREGIDGELFPAGGGLSKPPQMASEVDVRCTTTHQKTSVFAQVGCDPESVVETPGGFLGDFISAATGD